MSPQSTMPPLTLAVPSISQQADTVDSVASMARKHGGSLMSAGVDQWSLLGLRHENIKEKKDKQGHRKNENKVEMCLQQRLQRLLVLKRNTSEITTTA